MMDNLQKYKPTDKMIDLISDNYSLLQVMSRFGLSLGFGDKTVKEVCELNGVDCRTFLIVVNFMAEGHRKTRLGLFEPFAIFTGSKHSNHVDTPVLFL